MSINKRFPLSLFLLIHPEIEMFLSKSSFLNSLQLCDLYLFNYSPRASFIILKSIGFFRFKLILSILYMKSKIFPYDLSILLIIKSTNFLSIDIWRSDKFFNISANIKSSPGFSILHNKKFLDLEFKSLKLKEYSTSGVFEVKIKYLLS